MIYAVSISISETESKTQLSILCIYHIHIFFHPDFTVGLGISPNHALRLVGCTTGRESHPALKILDSISGSIIAWYITECKPFLKPGQNRDGTTFRRRTLSRGLAPSSSLSFCQSFHRVFLQAAESDVFSKASLPHGRQNRLIIPPVKKNRAFPMGNALFFISLSYVDFGRVRPGGRTLFFTMLHHFLRAASGIRHQHGSGSDAAHPGIVPIFCAGMPCKLARRQCHFPAYCPILSA